ncbi:MAG TPA: alpha-amylase, partial [Lachnospiraceae bacterium]|nr:alpha-amylase [Lachnospiraceae bacterium]
EAQQAMLALIFTVPGMPLIYSGQEVNLDHRLEFFEKDQILWEDFVNEELLTKLIHLKKEHPALWNGEEGGDIVFLETTSERVLAYRRQKGEDEIVAVINLSGQKTKLGLTFENEFQGTDLLTTNPMTFCQGTNELMLKPWEFIILSK